MQRYFLNDDEFKNKCFVGEKYHHVVNVMRKKVNDQFIVCYQKKAYLASITSTEENGVLFNLEKEVINNPEFPFKITIIQGYPKADKMDYITQKSVELGVSEILPCLMERTIVKLENDKRKSKEARLNKIALEAARQSARLEIPVVLPIIKLTDIDFSQYDKLVFGYEEDAKNGINNNLKGIIRSINDNERVAFLIGPEGGISPAEASYLIEKGFVSTSFGKRILRTETAPLYVLSAISYEKEE